MGVLTKPITQPNTLTNQELTYLLTLIAKSTFDGRDVYLLNSIVTKISGTIKENEARDQ